MNTIHIILLALVATPFVVLLFFVVLRLIQWVKVGRHDRIYLKHHCGHMHPFAAPPRECPACHGRDDQNNDRWDQLTARQKLFGGYVLKSDKSPS